MEQPKARLTLQQHQQAIYEARWIDASPHEWPTIDKMWLLCSALIDSVQMVDYLRIRLAAVEAERDAARAASEKDREWVGRALEKQAEYLGQSQMLVAERDAARAGEARAVEALDVFARAYRVSMLPFAPGIDEADGAHHWMPHGWPSVADFKQANAALTDSSALDWLAQQRREAAAEALEEFGYDADGIEELITCNIFDLRSALRTRAASLRAGEVADAK